MNKNDPQLPLYFSFYLDVVRFIAAVAVFLEHISSYPFTKNVFAASLKGYGGIAVIVFFVLSGYVIAYVTSTRKKTLAKYAVARISRIYSVVLIALLITFILDNIGMFLNPDFYSIQKIMWKPQSMDGYVSSLFFINEYQIFNFNGISPGSNAPYWSLSFEVTYYLIAGLFIFTRKAIALPIILLVLLLAGKTIAVLLPAWLIGYLLYFVTLKNVNRIVLYVCFILSLLFLVELPSLTKMLPKDNFGFSFPWGRGPFNRNLIRDYLTVLFFSVNLICAREMVKTKISKVNKNTKSFIRWLGQLTFPLYLLHFPALAFFASLSPWSNETLSHVFFISLFTFLLAIAVTPLSNKFKNYLKNSLVFKRKVG
jgi:peptidoglycan/LPS O-acetylase OafA/YrhL